MKYIFFCFALVCFTFNLFAQKDSLSNSLKIELPLAKFSKGVLSETFEIPLLSPMLEKPDITDEYWNTIVYNPYKNTMQQFPMVLNFSDSTYASPVPRTKVVTSHYGWRNGRAHKGIDIDLTTGDSVVAVLDGIVRYARYTNGFGNTVVVRHYNGLESTYAHLSRIDVKANDSIAKGQYLGKGGNTGNSRGSHLHLELSYKGQPIHPEYLFDFSPKNAIRAEQVWVTQKWAHARFHNSKRVSPIKVIKSADEAVLHNLAKQPKVYVVRKGDTLYGISRRHRMSVAKLCKTNAITQTAPLKIGQTLVLEL